MTSTTTQLITTTITESFDPVEEEYTPVISKKERFERSAEKRRQKLKQTQPEQTQPEQIQPEQIQPGQIQPGQIQSGQIQPEQIQPGQIQSGQIQPEQTQPELASNFDSLKYLQNSGATSFVIPTPIVSTRMANLFQIPTLAPNPNPESNPKPTRVKHQRSHTRPIVPEHDNVSDQAETNPIPSDFTPVTNKRFKNPHGLVPAQSQGWVPAQSQGLVPAQSQGWVPRQKKLTPQPDYQLALQQARTDAIKMADHVITGCCNINEIDTHMRYHDTFKPRIFKLSLNEQETIESTVNTRTWFFSIKTFFENKSVQYEICDLVKKKLPCAWVIFKHDPIGNAFKFILVVDNNPTRNHNRNPAPQSQP
jgi:hypothetical protein